MEVVPLIRHLARGMPFYPKLIVWDKIKNKQGDHREKWKHWLKLSTQSGFGFNPDTEMYEAFDYVQEHLNKAEPRIIWHKTHVLHNRPEQAEILHDARATGE